MLERKRVESFYSSPTHLATVSSPVSPNRHADRSATPALAMDTRRYTNKRSTKDALHDENCIH